MAEASTPFRGYPARDPQTLLRLLVQVTPLVTLHTSQGHALTGQLLALEGDGPRASVLLDCADEKGETGSDIAYLLLGDVVAVKVHDGLRWSGLLADAAATVPGERAPSREELQRHVQHLSEDLRRRSGLGIALEVDWTGVPDSDDARLNLRDLLAAVAGSLGDEGSEAAGRAAVAGLNVITIVHRPGANLSFASQAPRLYVGVDLHHALPRPLAKVVGERLQSSL
ncbi:MAG: hypothetical protein KGL53_06100 [Elusimicrobia bacterium]|nr:hypothetical protein [Elusimicrobiota bacterium]